MKLNLEKLGENIKEYRLESDYSQADLAWMIGSKQQRIAEWESGKIEPSLRFVLFIAEALGTDMANLVRGVVTMDNE